MKKYLLLALVAIICFCGCEKEELGQLDSKGETNSAFFRHNKSGDEFTNFIISSLSHADDSIAFTGDFVNTYGIPKWGVGFSINAEDRSSLIIPILDEDNQFISALYYLKYKNNYIETYILMNDEDDIAYDETKHLIQFFETKLGLERSNKDFELIEPSRLKYSAVVVEECYSWWQTVSFADGSFYTSRESECSYGTEVIFDGFTSGGGSWANSGGGNYPPNGSYGGKGKGNTDPIPDPVPEITYSDAFKKEITNCLSEKLLVNESYKNLVNQFVPDGSEFELFFDIDSDMKNSAGNPVNGQAYCEGDENGQKTVTIYIDSDMFGTSSSLEIARTISHEVIHAYMYELLFTFAPSQKALDFRNTWSEYTKNGQHNIMADSWVDTMAKILNDIHSELGSDQFFNYFDEYATENQRMDFYKSLAWQGLKNTCSWDALSPEDIDKIEKDNSNAKMGAKDCN